jgi:hypothetical protein
MTITEAELAAAILQANDPADAVSADSLQIASNLSDLASAATSRTNLGLGTAATLASSAVFQTANNLSEGTAATMRTSLGLGTGATQNLVTGFVARQLVAGGAAGNITVTGIKTTDTLAAVIRFIGAGVAVTDVTDLTTEFTISATNTINNTSGTASTSDKLLVIWVARS